MNPINSNSKSPGSASCSKNESCESLADTNTSNRYEQRLESIYTIIKRSSISKKWKKFISQVVRSGCFGGNGIVHCTICHKSVSAAESRKYIKDKTVDKFHEASCSFFQEYNQDTAVTRKSNESLQPNPNESLQPNPVANTNAICSVITAGNHTCQELASMNHIRNKLMFMGQGAILLRRGFNRCALSLAKDGCFRIVTEEFHCSQCHKSVRFEDGKQYCLENLSNKFHESHCVFFKTNYENTVALVSNQLTASSEDSLATNYSRRHSLGLSNEASSSSHACAAATLKQSSASAIDDTVLSGEDVANYAYKSFAYLDERVKSFTKQNWPHANCHTPEAMAIAGFFYSGYGDLAVCSYCGIGIMQWDSSDEPELEHAKWSSNCAYIKQLKGAKFINDTQVKYRESIASPANACRHTVARLPMTQNKKLIVGVTSESNHSSSMFGATSSLTQRSNTNT